MDDIWGIENFPMGYIKKNSPTKTKSIGQNIGWPITSDRSMAWYGCTIP